jgi:hypothetical protein
MKSRAEHAPDSEYDGKTPASAVQYRIIGDGRR